MSKHSYPPSKKFKRPSWSKKSDKWDKFKEQDVNPIRGDGPESHANTWGDKGYDKEADV